MANNLVHKPVMLDEVIHYLQPEDGKTYIDATFGAGGYTRAILAAANCKVIALDQDPSVSKYFPANDNFKFIAGNFGDLETLVTEKVDGIVFDIGVSSMQLDEAVRGFSFMKDGPLDMRMSSTGMSAADFLNTADEEQIADVIYKYGEDKGAKSIARAIVAARPLTTTAQLANVTKFSLNATARTFQAIRIYINRELEVLERGLEAALKLLKDGGRLVVVTFHSLEDRIVKLFFKKHSAPKEKTNKYAAKTDAKKINSELEIITKKAIMPQDAETKTNPRARSAKLRAATKQGV
jgi:16S rRNA (cytosine1402-N4)-methyltransferase